MNKKTIAACCVFVLGCLILTGSNIVQNGNGNLVPYLLYPHEIDTGAGTTPSPWVNADNTAGIQTEINSLQAARGGLVVLAAGKFRMTTGVTITTANQTVMVQGQAPSFSISGAIAEGTTANIIELTNAASFAFSVGGGSLGAEPTGITLSNLYIWGGQGVTPNGASNAGIVLTSFCDQPKVDTARISNTGTAVYVSFMDGGRIEHSSFHHNGYGVYLSGTSWFGQINDNQTSDNDYHGVYASTPGTTDNVILQNNVYVRNCTLAACSTNPANVYWNKHNSSIVANTFADAGFCLLGCGGGRNRQADELFVAGNFNTVQGNNFQETGTQNASFGCIRLTGNSNLVAGNSFQGCATDIIVTGSDNRINQPGAVVADSGTRTVINGVSVNAGDPDAAGAWNGVAKWPGLVIQDTTNNIQYLYYTATLRTTVTFH